MRLKYNILCIRYYSKYILLTHYNVYLGHFIYVFIYVSIYIYIYIYIYLIVILIVIITIIT